MIELKNITKIYSGSTKLANNNINLSINKGEILCIAGENGAGKTTLMKILCDLEKPTTGEIIKNKNEKIGMVHQHFMLFPEYTVSQNITIKKPPLKYKIFLDNKKANEYADKIIKENNFDIHCTQKVKDLTLGQMQQTEICRVLYGNADIIILDEPTAILTEEETQNLFFTLRKLKKEGKTIIFITHKMKEIKEISDRVVVLKKGEVINNEELGVRSEELNENLSAAVPLREISSPIIEFQNVTVKRKGQKLPLLDNVSFSVSAKEILGFTGTGGNGLGVIEAVLGGFLHPCKGRVLHNGKDISKYSIRKLRNEGLSFVPSDRKLYGTSLNSTVEENLIINCKDKFFKYGFYNKKEALEFSKKLINEYSITGELNKNASALSGGNLQKLILAREISNLKDYIVFSEPTWGLDVNAACFIMNEILKLKEKGAAVILISTNTEEVYALSDKVIVMNKGRISESSDKGAGSSE